MINMKKWRNLNVMEMGISGSKMVGFSNRYVGRDCSDAACCELWCWFDILYILW